MADVAEAGNGEGTAVRRRAAADRTNKSEEDLEDQIARLRDDVKGIAATLARLTERKMADVKGEAEASVTQLMRTGQQALDEVGNQASAIEGDLKRLVREKPLTAVATALGVGFLLAVLSRR
jgi:ElaB/YqjD/DUF883 family membrane-anchored ribosome-binding protein